MDQVVTFRHLHPCCRGGSLSSAASRRLPRTQKTERASSAPSPLPGQDEEARQPEDTPLHDRGDGPSCHHQATRSRLSWRLAIVSSEASFAEDPRTRRASSAPSPLPTRLKNPPARNNATTRQGRWAEPVKARQIGPTCRGGSLLFKVSRRLPRNKKIPRTAQPRRFKSTATTDVISDVSAGQLNRGDSRARRLRT